MNDSHIDREELDKLVRLLQEYTAKLREVCEHRADTRLRLIQIVGIMGAVMAGLMSVFIFSFEVQSSNLGTSMAIIPAVVIVFMTMYLTMMKSRFRYSFDADRIAASVERLVRLASQFNEHSGKSVSDKFELDLRIAEAEGALRYYQRIFQVEADWTRKD